MSKDKVSREPVINPPLSHDRQTLLEGDGGEQLIDGGKVMSLFDHLGELRGRLVISLLAVIVFFGIAMVFSTELLLFLKQPLVDALPGQVTKLHFTGPLDVFMVSMKVSFLAAIICACPVWLYQFWRFVEPALYAKERRFILPFVVVSVLLFIIGVLFSYYGIVPMTLQFLLAMGAEVGTPMITINDYISMLTMMIIGFGFVFEAPLILVLLGILDIVTAKALAEARRYVIVIILIIAAILTPPDPLSQLGMSIPLYIMYEFSIVVIRFIDKRKKT